MKKHRITISLRDDMPVGSITMHAETWGSDPHMSVNVKFYGPLDIENADEVEDWMINAAHSYTRDEWWVDAAAAAHKAGYSGVFANGRSAGWCVPYWQTERGKLVAHFPGNYPGTGPDKGYPIYPDIEDNVDCAQFLWFQDRINEMLSNGYIQEIFTRQLSEIVEEHNQEVAEITDLLATGFPIVDGNGEPMWYL